MNRPYSLFKKFLESRIMVSVSYITVSIYFFKVFFLLASVLTCLGYHFKYYRYCFNMCVCMSVLYVRACAFVPVIFLLDSCMSYVRARPIARLYIYSDSAN